MSYTTTIFHRTNTSGLLEGQILLTNKKCSHLVITTLTTNFLVAASYMKQTLLVGYGCWVQSPPPPYRCLQDVWRAPVSLTFLRRGPGPHDLVPGISSRTYPLHLFLQSINGLLEWFATTPSPTLLGNSGNLQQPSAAKGDTFSLEGVLGSSTPEISV